VLCRPQFRTLVFARPVFRTCVALVHGKRACPKRTTHELLSFSRRVVPAP
jgi:hypothetical protein